MKIELRKFGHILISRPAGREGALAVRAYLTPQSKNEPIEIDFTGVDVMGPSWIDEFVQGLKEKLKNPIKFLPSNNSSVIESLKFVSKE